MALVQLKNIKKSFRLGDEQLEILHGIDLTVEKGEFVAMMGPSGSGKSTTMNILGCLDKPTSGEYFLDGRNVADLDRDQLAAIRNSTIGFVFQGFNLLQKTSALENVELPMLYAGVPAKERHRRAKEALEHMGLGDRLHHEPNQLSGGQQQRVAIARALVNNPAIICLDEPLSNLDAKLRVQLRGELKEMQKNFGITTVYVTHDQEEALTLSDCIAVFNNGVIEQIGAPNEIYNHSKTEFVCNFIGDINKVQPQLLSEIAAQTGAALDPKKASYVRLERVHVNMPAASGFASFKAKVVSREYYGLYIKYTLSLCGQTVKSIEKNDGTKYFETGEEVSVFIKPDDLMVY